MRQFLAVAFIAFALMTSPGAATAAEPSDEFVGGLAVGAPIPDGFGLPDQTGTHRGFASLKGERGLILLFTRSLDW